MRRVPPTDLLVAATALAALPFLALGAGALARPGTPVLLVAGLAAAAVVLSFRPIRVRADVELAPSDIAVLTAILFAPPGCAALVAAAGRVGARVFSRRLLWRAARDVAAATVSAGAASLLYELAIEALAPRLGDEASIPAAVAASLLFLALELGQLAMYQATLGRLRELGSASALVTPAGRAQLLWLLAGVVALEMIRIQPLFLVPGIPLFALGYAEIRARSIAERRARLLAVAVEVSHAVASTLDVIEVFRAVYRQVAAVLEADAFFVAITDADRKRLLYRFLVDESQELEPQERELAGTLAGACIERGEPILLRDAERERSRYVSARIAWGTVVERSIMVAPLRLRGEVIGAISVQSVHVNAYDREDLELIQDIANEAAIAIERAELHERRQRLSQRLFSLHRVGVELVSQRDQGQLARRLAAAASELLAGRAAVYLDTGGDALVRADATGSEAGEGTQTIQKRGSASERALATGQPLEIGSPEELPEPSRTLLTKAGQRSVLIQPLRAADEPVGVLYVAWTEPHKFNDEERELAGIVAGIGATALRSLRLYGELEDAYLSTVTTLTATIQAREGYREDHLRNVAADAVALGQRLGLADDALRALRYSALFHSLGKIAVPASVLSKAGPLTSDEMRMVRDHPALGAQIVSSIRFLQDVAPIVRHANERWDGDGYPDGLAGEAIPRLSRILHVAVAFHALRVDRPYRAGISTDAALALLRAESGVRFDPLLVEEFARMIEGRGAIAQAEQELAGAREMAILSEITPEFHSLLDLQQLLERVLRLLERRMPDSRLAIMLEDPATDDLVLRASAGAWSPSAQRRIPRTRGIVGWVVEHGKPQVVDDVLLDARFLPTGDDSRSALVVPLLAGGRAVGVLAILHATVGAFGQRDLTLMQAVGAQIAAAIEVAGLHERLKVAASTDALTGIHNYRYFWDRLEEEISRAERRSTPLSIAYFDIDKLKAVNDKYGHLAGDAVLRRLGQVIGSHVRGEDVPARYGGDEFAIVMPETPKDEAEVAVQRLMVLIDRADVDLGDGTTIPMPRRSCGVATYPTDARTAKELVESADRLAYAQKRAR